MINRKINSFWLGLFACLVTSLSMAQTVWIDVRSVEEYNDSHIEGDLFIPYQSIATGIKKYDLAKDSEIKLYCRSGGRAGKAKKALESVGYTQVVNAGGIDEVREQRKISP